MFKIAHSLSAILGFAVACVYGVCGIEKTDSTHQQQIEITSQQAVKNALSADATSQNSQQKRIEKNISDRVGIDLSTQELLAFAFSACVISDAPEQIISNIVEKILSPLPSTRNECILFVDSNGNHPIRAPAICS